jgi:DNA topoisomerase-2
MVLINGCEGIGTGYSTYIPPYNPSDIVANLIRIMDDNDPLPMKPYFKNFHGELLELENSSYMTIGKWQRLSDTQIKITELPIGCGVTTYKEFLESFIEGNSNTSKTSNKTNSNGSTNTKTTNTKTKKKISLKDVQNKTRDENDDICFIVEFSKASDLDELVKTNTLEKTLRLTRSFTTNNMYLFSEDLILTKYKNATDILLDFYDLRLEFYEKRKEYLVKRLQNELLLLNSKIRFIEEYIGGSLDINKKSKEYILSLLEQRGYPKLKWNNDNKNNRNDNKEGNGDSDDNESNVSNVSFDYLIRMPIFSLSLEKIKELENQRDNKKSELATLQSKTEKDLWKEDLIKVSKYF